MTQDSSRKILVDIGNSGLRAVCAPLDSAAELPPPIRIQWNAAASQTKFGSTQFAPDQQEWTERLTELLSPSELTQWWISSVHRPATKVLVDFLSHQKNCEWELVDYARIAISIDVEFPERVGIDRILAAYAACHFSLTRPLLVIQAGSAVTVDLVDVANSMQRATGSKNADCFRGGAILPGVPMMLRLLSSAADMLPSVEPNELADLPPLPGRNSQAAMLAGVASSLIGGVQHLVGRYRQKFSAEIPIVLSGGDGPLLAPHLNGSIQEVDHLVLQGLRILSTHYNGN